MKRFPAYDPAEYQDWKPDTATMTAYKKRITDDSDLSAAVSDLGAAGIERLYKGLVRFRLHDVTLKRWVRTGVLTKAWLGTGEEATTIGALQALGADDVVGPMIRNQAAAFEKGIPLAECFKVYLATSDTITRGRDLHIGALEHNVVSPISHVGDLVPVLGGFALAFQQRDEQRVALTWCGDGATRTGAFHEGLAFAAALKLPMIVIVQDNGVALGTGRSDHLEQCLRGIPAGYGVQGFRCDGNHVLDVYHTVQKARERCLAGEGPAVVLARTFRMGGHATHDEAEARDLFDRDVFAEWGKRCPIGCFEEWICTSKKVKSPRKTLAQWESEVNEEVEAAAAEALSVRDSAVPDPADLQQGLFAAAP